ncbi:MAG: hypothetical protein WBC51_24145 [Vicinamibacterales bacterium]
MRSAGGNAMCTIAVALLVCSSCSDPERDRLKATTQATYDERSGRLKELTYDANRNGRIDTWTEMDGSRPVRSRLDRNEDGRIDRWESYDASGRLVKVGFSRRDNGQPDAWAELGPEGRIGRVLVSSTGDEARIDRWETYDPAAPDVLAAVEEDANHDGRPDKWETYAAGQLQKASFDENGDGRADRRLTYRAGSLVLIESEPDGTGQFQRRVEVK